MNKSITFAVNLCGFSPQRVKYFQEYGLPTLEKNAINPIVFEDKQKRNGSNPCWSAARDTWIKLANSNSEYVCCLADDFEYHPEMMSSVQCMIENHPNSAVSFFQPAIIPNDRFFEKNDLSMNYQMGELLWGGSIVLPRKIVNKVIFWCDQFTNVSSDDEKIAFALAIIGIPSYSSGQNYAFHYGAYLDSTIPSNINMSDEDLAKRADIRSGLSRDIIQDIKYKYKSSKIKTTNITA